MGSPVAFIRARLSCRQSGLAASHLLSNSLQEIEFELRSAVIFCDNNAFQVTKSLETRSTGCQGLSSCESSRSTTLEARGNWEPMDPIAAPAQWGSGRNRARTCDPLLVRQVLYQLSYSPVR